MKPIVLFEEWGFIDGEDIVMINEKDIDSVNPSSSEDED